MNEEPLANIAGKPLIEYGKMIKVPLSVMVAWFIFTAYLKYGIKLDPHSIAMIANFWPGIAISTTLWVYYLGWNARRSHRYAGRQA